MVTLKNIIDDFSNIATNHYLINSFHSGFLDEVDINKLDQADFRYYIVSLEQLLLIWAY